VSVIVFPDEVKVVGVAVSCGNAFTGSGGFVEGQDVMNGAARENTWLSV